MDAERAALVSAAAFLATCLVTFWWATRPGAAGYRHTVLVFTWLCAALSAALVIFSTFPASAADGDVFGVTLGGAGAFVVLVWTAAIRAGRAAGRHDDRERGLRERERRLAEREVAAERTARGPRPLVYAERHLYAVPGAGGRRVGIVTGDIRGVRCADVWVNSENTAMSMADPYDDSISGIIRYEGGRRNPLGRVVEDLVGEALEQLVAGGRPVPPGTAVVTGAGELRRNGVRWIVHVAAVLGQPGEGYRQVRDVGRCAAKAMAAVDNDGSPLGRTVLMPLLGTGYGRGDVEDTARALLGAVVSYLAENRRTAIEEVYLLAYTDDELAVCRRVFDASDLAPVDETR